MKEGRDGTLPWQHLQYCPHPVVGTTVFGRTLSSIVFSQATTSAEKYCKYPYQTNYWHMILAMQDGRGDRS